MVRVSSGNSDLDKMLFAMLQNVELLCNLRATSNDAAVVKGDIETDYPADPADNSLASLQALKETVRALMVDLKT